MLKMLSKNKRKLHLPKLKTVLQWQHFDLNQDTMETSDVSLQFLTLLLSATVTFWSVLKKY